MEVVTGSGDAVAASGVGAASVGWVVAAAVALGGRTRCHVTAHDRVVMEPATVANRRLIARADRPDFPSWICTVLRQVMQSAATEASAVAMCVISL